MHKLRLIARREYLACTRRRSFLIVTIGIPLLIVAVMAVSILVAFYGGKTSALGYVDHSAVLATERDNPGFKAFPDVEAAKAALASSEIDAYCVLPADYFDTGQMELFYLKKAPSSRLQERFDDFVKANLVTGLEPALAERALHGPEDIMVRSADGSREQRGAGFFAFLLPFVLGLFFTFALMSSSSYLLRAIADEKQNRTAEIMATSVSPTQFMVGKAAGLLGAAFTQVVLWAVVVVAGIAVVSRFAPVEAHLPLSLTALLLAYFIPLFVMAGTLVIIIGIAVNDTNQGQQIAAALSMLFLLPLFLSPLVSVDPDNIFMVVLTLFPGTSLLTIAVRWGATVIPLWQLIAAWLILALSAGAGLWAAPNVFRYGMLRYGRRLTLTSIVRGLREQRSA